MKDKATDQSTVDCGATCTKDKCCKLDCSKPRPEVAREFFYGAQLTGEWFANTGKMQFKFTAPNNVEIKKVVFVGAKKPGKLQYPIVTTGNEDEKTAKNADGSDIWTKSAADDVNCVTTYTLKADQNVFFGD